MSSWLLNKPWITVESWDVSKQIHVNIYIYILAKNDLNMIGQCPIPDYNYRTNKEKQK